MQLSGNNTIVLGLADNTLRTGDAVSVTYDLKDARGLAIKGTARAMVR